MPSPHACPPDVAAKIAAGLVETEALRVALEWLESPSKVLVLQGGTGSGKSVAAGWLHDFFRARPVHSDAGARRGPAWFAAKVLGAVDPRDRETWAAFDSATLITLDDVGTELWPERIGSAIERVWDVTSARLVITTNLDADVVVPASGPGRYGERVASRMQGATWVVLAAPDYRGGGPVGPKWPSPSAPTEREREATRARHEAEDRERAEYEAGAEEREKKLREILATSEALAGAKILRLPVAGNDASDNERRRQLARQSRRAEDGSEGIRAAWLDDGPARTMKKSEPEVRAAWLDDEEARS